MRMRRDDGTLEDIVQRAIDVVENGKVRFVPDRWAKVYLDWMENIRDWCISRQLWWGHRIPVWYCQDCSHVNVNKTAPETCESCNSRSLQQEEDILDT
ncbi:MAG: class I tRNA ligase family protein, partial [Armatimonadetes bacterium]|nr:class I tRNA ligase family protein [Armatimonadota bacterium]NIM22745.1 class I tRNA ligase family protein [Armatimonadota bacterium]NIM66570.1 class I tRNA ligase family protein [Armatimonadota bacterium]NIM75171.1 class I tRNA ligase family protein [Armatimonadota bacterium]NIN04795.1 class I tRNA ligase family protein [Armatimonadota bacterium]